jgi:hypothetical protein
LSLVSLWLDKFCQITTKDATVTPSVSKLCILFMGSEKKNQCPTQLHKAQLQASDTFSINCEMLSCSFLDRAFRAAFVWASGGYSLGTVATDDVSSPYKDGLPGPSLLEKAGLCGLLFVPGPIWTRLEKPMCARADLLLTKKKCKGGNKTKRESTW